MATRDSRPGKLALTLLLFLRYFHWLRIGRDELSSDGEASAIQSRPADEERRN